MKARLVIFPVRGRNWCFSRSIDQSTSDTSSQTPTTFKELWKKVSSSSFPDKPIASNVELLVDFASNKMNKAWITLEKAPAGSFKSKIHGLGLRLLSRVRPSEMFLKSISNDITSVEVMYPTSLNPRLVRRRLRHVALRGTAIHKKYFIGSISLLPLTTVFAVLPLPNIPFFWILFRTYSHWRARKGSEKLLQLVSDHSDEKENHGPLGSPWVLQPSEQLERLISEKDEGDGVNQCTISEICNAFDLNKTDVLRYQHSL